MALLSSKTLIQLHALFLFILAVYLVVSPGAVTDSGIVFILGEAIQIDVDPSLTSAQFPFAICSILLVSEALVDLIIVTKLPQIDDLINPTLQQEQQRSVPSISPRPTISPLMAHMAALYSEVWTFLAGARFCFYFGIAFFIYQGKPDATDRSGKASAAYGFNHDQQTRLGLAQLRSRVVFTFVFVEMMFWLWTLSNVREERREVATRLAERQAAERERGLY